MDYRSQGYPQHDVVGTSYYNAAPVFLRQPVRPFLASFCNNSFFNTFCPSSTIFYTRLLLPRNSSGTLKAPTLSLHLLIFVRLSKSAVKPFEVSPTLILGCRRSSRDTTRLFHLNLLVLQTGRNLETGTLRCTERSGQQTGYHMYFEGSRVSLISSPPSFFLSKVGLDANCGRVLDIFVDYRMTNQAAFAPIEIWSRMHHPSIVPVREAFTTLSFNDNCMSS